MSIHEPQITDSAFLSRTSAFSPIAYKPSYPEMRRWWRLSSLLGCRQLMRRIGPLLCHDDLLSFSYPLCVRCLPFLQVLIRFLCTLEDGQVTMNVCPCHIRALIRASIVATFASNSGRTRSTPGSKNGRAGR